jgi:hypothetical protein
MSRVIAEHYASDAVRETLGLSWQVWGGRLNSYLQMLELFFFTGPADYWRWGEQKKAISFSVIYTHKPR